MAGKAKLLIIEDDANLAEALSLYLTTAGYKVVIAPNGHHGLQKMYVERPHLIILDIMMPGLDGWEVCGRIREISKVPIIMLTARGQEDEKVRGLQMGADDYVAKPFSLRELEARIESILRRTADSPAAKTPFLYSDDELVIDAERWAVSKRGEVIELTATERRILFLLAENKGRVLPAASILEKIWGREYVDEADYVKLYIWRIRQKIETDPSHPQYIHTERGLGYRFAREP
jgi:two-component system KDP operon response regulator KdpE